ncbi:MAG: cellulose biosynthesis protein BcsS [Pseudolabrys sp.]|nr:cellulose biosynthesis protein BcsS [Pseudolabrys sp.]
MSSVPSRADDEEARLLLFSGRDIWRNGAFLHSGVLFAPGGFEQDGLMFKLLLGGGVYRYVSGALGGEKVIGAEWTVQAMPGFRIKRGNAELKFFFGLDWQRHKLWPNDPDNRLTGQNFGLRMTGELWYEPTRDSLIAGDVSVSSIATSHSSRLAFGWRVAQELFTDGVYVGPEAQYFGSDGYRHRRLGLHITSMKTEDTEWSAAGGLAHDSDGRASLYVRLGLSSKLTD